MMSNKFYGGNSSWETPKYEQLMRRNETIIDICAQLEIDYDVILPYIYVDTRIHTSNNIR